MCVFRTTLPYWFRRPKSHIVMHLVLAAPLSFVRKLCYRVQTLADRLQDSWWHFVPKRINTVSTLRLTNCISHATQVVPGSFGEFVECFLINLLWTSFDHQRNEEHVHFWRVTGVALGALCDHRSTSAECYDLKLLKSVGSGKLTGCYWNNYGTSPYLVGKSTVNGHFQ